MPTGIFATVTLSERSVRILLSSFVSLAFGQPAASAQGCASTPERLGFEVVGLKGQLIMTPPTCSTEEHYNAFVIRYLLDLVRQERTLTSYFERSFGRGAAHEHDDYITALANAQSPNGINMDMAFCAQSTELFD